VLDFLKEKNRRAERRRKQGRCVKCGYSLRGNESGVCSECGTSVEEE